MAGLVTLMGLRLADLSLHPVLTALFLAGPVWGALWAQIACWQGADGGWARLPELPYTASASPARRLQDMGAFLLILAILAGVASLLAAWINPAALWLSAIAVLAALAGLIVRQAGWQAAFYWLQAMSVAALPFALGASLVDVEPLAEGWPGLLIQVAGFTALAQASLSVAAGHAPGLLTPAVGAILLVAALVLAGLYFAAGLVALIACAPLLLLAGRVSAMPGSVQAWWWLATLVTALSLGSGIG